MVQHGDEYQSHGLEGHLVRELGQRDGGLSIGPASFSLGLPEHRSSAVGDTGEGGIAAKQDSISEAVDLKGQM